jgi:hypothetical protein
MFKKAHVFQSHLPVMKWPKLAYNLIL